MTPDEIHEAGARALVVAILENAILESRYDVMAARWLCSAAAHRLAQLIDLGPLQLSQWASTMQSIDAVRVGSDITHARKSGGSRQ